MGALVVLALLFAVPAHAAPLTVCAFSFHSAREVEVFESWLPADDFDVVVLSPPPLVSPGASGAEHPAGASAGHWLSKACRRDLRCDVVVYSGEFAGRFFGDYGSSLTLQEMEEASCRPECDGLFHDPQEVFLLACNTLATKDEDRRTPDDYLHVLLDHGFDRASAERVVAARYGPLGPSFREALRRVFMGVPRLYGFGSVAPVGAYTGPRLETYFRRRGDYRRYLERSRGSSAPNAPLLAAFRGTGLVQTTGLAADEPAVADRESICTIYDERESPARRLDVIRTLMARDDFLAFIPSIQVFVDRHPPQELDPEARRIFDEIQGSDAAREKVLRLVHELDVSALQVEMAHFALRMGWTTPEDFRRFVIAAATELLRRPLTSEIVDVMCEIPKHQAIGAHFRSEDLREALFTESEGIRLIDCLGPADARVTPRLARALDDPDPSTRLWAAYALSHRLPLDDAVLAQVERHRTDPSPDLRARVEWILEAQRASSHGGRPSRTRTRGARGRYDGD